MLRYTAAGAPEAWAAAAEPSHLPFLKYKDTASCWTWWDYDDKSEPRVCVARHLAQQTRLLRTVARPGTGELVAEKGEASISR